jgi:hypothetical protein
LEPVAGSVFCGKVRGCEFERSTTSRKNHGANSPSIASGFWNLCHGFRNVRGDRFHGWGRTLTTDDAVGQMPAALPGLSGTQTIFRGWMAEGLTFVCAVCNGFESKLKRYEFAWEIVFLSIGMASLIFGVFLMITGYRKLAREARLGYTSSAVEARKKPKLWYAHPRTLQVICGPGVARPPRTPSAKVWASSHPEMPYLRRPTRVPTRRTTRNVS